MKIFLFTLDFESCRVDQAAAQPKSLRVGLMEPCLPASLCAGPSGYLRPETFHASL